jgi:hypothetical protein
VAGNELVMVIEKKIPTFDPRVQFRFGGGADAATDF